MRDYVLALDIGGSSVKSGLFSRRTYDAEQPLEHSFPAIAIEGRSFSNVRSAVEKAISIALERNPVDKIGISTTGSVLPSGIVKNAGHFDDYKMVDWKELLASSFSGIRDVLVQNDGKASAWAEYSYINNEAGSHVHFVIGTGVGSSMVVNGQLIHGDAGEAGYLGHTRVTCGETIVCSCGRTGCLETVASGPGLVAEYNKISGRASVTSLDEFLKLLSRRDMEATLTLQRACRAFGKVVAPVINGINPQTVSFGGGVILGLREALADAEEGSTFLDMVRSENEKRAFQRSASSTDFRYGVFNNDGGLVGVGLLAGVRATT